MKTLMLFILFSPVYIPFTISITLWLNASRHNYAKKTLSLSLLNMAFLFFGLYFFLSGNYEFYSSILIVNVTSLLLVYPSIYLYVRLLLNPSYPPKKIALHLTPVAFTILQAILYYLMMNTEERLLFVTDFRYNPKWDDTIMVIFYFFRIINLIILFTQIIYYGIKTHIILRKYDIKIHQIFSNTEGIKLNSIRLLNFSLLISSIAAIAFYSINPIKIFGNYMVLIIPLSIISITIWMMGIIGLRQSPLPKPDKASLSVNTSVEDSHSNDILYNRVLDYFQSHHPYLNPELKIDDLIIQLGTNRTHLSNTINTCSGKNFNRFVNDYRIEYALNYIDKHNGKCSKDETATQSGFGSVRSFERNFKETLHKSYSEYCISL